MKYPVAVWADNGVYSAAVPDLPGVITEADSIDELERCVAEAAIGWMEAELADGHVVPSPSSVEKYREDEAFARCMWLLVDIDGPQKTPQTLGDCSVRHAGVAK